MVVVASVEPPSITRISFFCKGTRLISLITFLIAFSSFNDGKIIEIMESSHFSSKESRFAIKKLFFCNNLYLYKIILIFKP